jgi:hypothetical protein
MLQWAAASLLVVLGSCPAPPPPREDACLLPAWASVQSRWPTAGAALADEAVYNVGEWYWAHQRGSVDGFGAVLATVDRKPDIRSIFALPVDLHASDDVYEPSLLFFDQTDGPSDTWPIIGMGYHYHFDPCARPKLECADPSDFFIHEAGYHATPVGDGGMIVAEPDDVKEGTELDADGCWPVHDEDLKTRFGKVRHGRAWVTHVWFPPAGEEGSPIWAVTDPWERWRDATDRSEVVGEAFFGQGECACDGSIQAPERSGGCF